MALSLPHHLWLQGCLSQCLVGPRGQCKHKHTGEIVKYKQNQLRIGVGTRVPVVPAIAIQLMLQQPWQVDPAPAAKPPHPARARRHPVPA